jgi:hypothetical protein
MTSKKAVAKDLISGVCATGQRKTIIVVAHAWYGDMIGGSFRLATEIARHFSGAGRRVIYVCCSDRVDRLTESEEEGVEIWRYPPPQTDRLRPSNLRYHTANTRIFNSWGESLKRSSPTATLRRTASCSLHEPWNALG